jgi:hypothetical protein
MMRKLFVPVFAALFLVLYVLNFYWSHVHPGIHHQPAAPHISIIPQFNSGFPNLSYPRSNIHLQTSSGSPACGASPTMPRAR